MEETEFDKSFSNNSIRRDDCADLMFCGMAFVFGNYKERERERERVCVCVHGVCVCVCVPNGDSRVLVDDGGQSSKYCSSWKQTIYLEVYLVVSAM